MVKNDNTLNCMYRVGTYVDATRAHYPTSRNAIKNAGFILAEKDSDSPIIWIDGIMFIEEAEKLKHYQRINKIPCMDYICFKSTLFEELNNLRKKYPNTMNFYPPTYLLPNEYPELQRQHTFICGRKSEAPTWVIKPKNGSCGKGIYFIQSSYEASNIIRPAVAQQMVDPFLLDGFKFDFRLFLLISSLDPYSAFIYKEGIARFCTEPYSPPSKANRDHYFMNLTNTAINIGSSKSPDQFTKRASEVIDKIIKSRPEAKNLWKSIIDLSRKLLASIYPTIIATLPGNGGKKIKRYANNPDISEDGKIRLCLSPRRPRTASSRQNSQNKARSQLSTSTTLRTKPLTSRNSKLHPNSSSISQFPPKQTNLDTSKNAINSINTSNLPEDSGQTANNKNDSTISEKVLESLEKVLNTTGKAENSNQEESTQSSTINFNLQNLLNNADSEKVQNSSEKVPPSEIAMNEQSSSPEDIFLSPSQHYFQILGMDIIIDSELQPKLLELNDRPSLCVTVPFEEDLKTNLMREMFYHVTEDARSLGENKDSGWQQILPVDDSCSDIYNDVRKLMNNSSNIKYTGRIAANSPTTNRMVSSGINKNLHKERRQRAVELRESSRGRRFNNYLKASPV